MTVYGVLAFYLSALRRSREVATLARPGGTLGRQALGLKKVYNKECGKSTSIGCYLLSGVRSGHDAETIHQHGHA